MEYSAIDTATATPLGARFTIDRQPLLKAVSFMAKRIVERRNTIRILSNIAFHIGEGAVQLHCTDLDIQAVTDLQCQSESHGGFTLDASTLCDLLKKVAPDSQVTLALDHDGKVTVSAGRVRSRLQALPIDDYPVIAHPIGGNCFTLSAEIARDFAALVPAISKEETRYYLNGICVQASAGRLHMTATDGKTLAMIDRAAPDGADGLESSIIPRKAIADVMAATGKTADPLSVNITSRFVQFHLEVMTITSKLIDGTFPDWRRAIELSIGDNPLEHCAIPFMNDRLALDVIAKLEKAADTPLSVHIGEKAALLSSEDYPEFCAVSYLVADSATPKGFSRQWDDQVELRAINYLTDLAEKAGLLTDFLDDKNARIFSTHWPRGESQPRMIGITFGGIVEHANVHSEPREIIDYHTFTTRTEFVQIETPEVWQDGAYSVAMPREAVFDHRQATVAVQGDDGTYSSPQWLAQNKQGAVSLSADHVAMLCGPVDPASFVDIPDVVFHRGEVVAVDGVATEAMPEGCTVNIAPTGKEAKALRDSMAQLARKNTPEAARELREIAARFDAIRPMRDYEIAGTPIAVEAAPSAPESIARPDVCSGPMWKGETWESVFSDLADPDFPVHIESIDGVYSIVNDWRAKGGKQRTKIPERHNQRAKVLFDEQAAKFSADNPLPSPPIGAQFVNSRGFFLVENENDKAIGYYPDYASAKAAHDAIEAMPAFPSKAWPFMWRWMISSEVGDNDCRPDLIALRDKWRADLSPVTAPETETAVSQGEAPQSSHSPATVAELVAVEADSPPSAELEDWQSYMMARFGAIEAKLDALTPLSPLNAAPPIGAKERTPAHVRAICVAWCKRRDVRLQRTIVDVYFKESQIEIARLERERDDARAQRDKASDHRRDLRKSRDDWEGLQQRTEAKRARAVLTARELQTRLNAEHRLVDRMHESLRGAKEDAATWQALAEAETQRTRIAETTLSAVQARADGWPPAVRSVNVQFGKAA
jgi:DNA polymerase III sliding clamp (beta) subunit (PCNA family)